LSKLTNSAGAEDKYEATINLLSLPGGDTLASKSSTLTATTSAASDATPGYTSTALSLSSPTSLSSGLSLPKDAVVDAMELVIETPTSLRPRVVVHRSEHCVSGYLGSAGKEESKASIYPLLNDLYEEIGEVSLALAWGPPLAYMSSEKLEAISAATAADSTLGPSIMDPDFADPMSAVREKMKENKTWLMNSVPTDAELRSVRHGVPPPPRPNLQANLAAANQSMSKGGALPRPVMFEIDKGAGASPKKKGLFSVSGSRSSEAAFLAKRKKDWEARKKAAALKLDEMRVRRREEKAALVVGVKPLQEQIRGGERKEKKERKEKEKEKKRVPGKVPVKAGKEKEKEKEKEKPKSTPANANLAKASDMVLGKKGAVPVRKSKKGKAAPVPERRTVLGVNDPFSRAETERELKEKEHRRKGLLKEEKECEEARHKKERELAIKRKAVTDDVEKKREDARRRRAEREREEAEARTKTEKARGEKEKARGERLEKERKDKKEKKEKERKALPPPPPVQKKEAGAGAKVEEKGGAGGFGGAGGAGEAPPTPPGPAAAANAQSDVNLGGSRVRVVVGATETGGKNYPTAKVEFLVSMIETAGGRVTVERSSVLEARKVIVVRDRKEVWKGGIEVMRGAEKVRQILCLVGRGEGSPYKEPKEGKENRAKKAAKKVKKAAGEKATGGKVAGQKVAEEKGEKEERPEGAEAEVNLSAASEEEEVSFKKEEGTNTRMATRSADKAKDKD
jgi:hypothetical protein